MQALLPEAVEPARRQVAEVERRGAEPPHRPRLGHEGAEQPDHLVDRLVHVVGEPGAEHRVDQRRGRGDAQRGAVEPGPGAPLGREELLAQRVVDRRHDRRAVDLEGQRRAEDRQAVRVVDRAVERVEHPAVPRTRRRAGPVGQLFRKDRVGRKPLLDHAPEPALDFEVDLRHQVDDAFLADPHVGPEVRALHRPGVQDGLGGGGHEQRIDRRGAARFRPAGGHSGAPSFLVIRTSIPPPGSRCRVMSSMKLRMKKMPRPLDRRRFSGASGSATAAGSNPGP